MSVRMKGIINTGVLVTIGLSFLGGLIAGVVELTQTKALAIEAQNTATFALTQTASVKNTLGNVQLNVARICIALKVKCIEPQ